MTQAATKNTARRGDMTVGVPWKALLTFSFPLFLGNIIQQMYNTVDTIVVGQYVGSNALAAVGTSFPLLMLLMTLFMGISMGSGVMISQYYGAKDDEMLSKTFHTTLVLGIYVSVFITIVGYFITPHFLRWINVPTEDGVYDMAVQYLQISFLGMFGSVLYNMFSGVLRGIGDSKNPLVFLSIACVMNIILDIVFVAVFHWDVAGVAWATIISQICSAIFAFIRLQTMRGPLKIHLNQLKTDPVLMKNMIKLGLPTAIQQATFSFANMLVQSLINGFGQIIMAGCNITMRLDSFAMMPNMTLGTAMMTYTGQNVGAGKMDRVALGARSGFKMGVGISLVITTVLAVFGRGLMHIFVSDSEAVINAGMRMVYIVAAGYVATAINQNFSGVMRGAGDTFVPMITSIITTVGVRLPVAYLLKYLLRDTLHPEDCIYYSLLFAWIVGAVITYIFYRIGNWKKKAVVRTRAAQPPAEA